MSLKDKLLRLFFAKPTDFTIAEMSTMLKRLGYERMKAGTMAGSRIGFINKTTGHMIRLHKPHPGPILKRYQLNLIEETLRAKGLLP